MRKDFWFESDCKNFVNLWLLWPGKFEYSHPLCDKEPYITDSVSLEAIKAKQRVFLRLLYIWRARCRYPQFRLRLRLSVNWRDLDLKYIYIYNRRGFGDSFSLYAWKHYKGKGL